MRMRMVVVITIVWNVRNTLNHHDHPSHRMFFPRSRSNLCASSVDTQKKLPGLGLDWKWWSQHFDLGQTEERQTQPRFLCLHSLRWLSRPWSAVKWSQQKQDGSQNPEYLQPGAFQGICAHPCYRCSYVLSGTLSVFDPLSLVNVLFNRCSE